MRVSTVERSAKGWDRRLHLYQLDKRPFRIVVQPATQPIRHRGSTPTEHDARPCFLMLHLDIAAWATSDKQPSHIWSAHWGATNNPHAFPSRSNPFQYLNNVHLSFASTTSEGHECDSASPPHPGAVNITISAQGISVLDGTSSMSAKNGLTINGLNRGIAINYIGAIMGDGFFGPIHRSIVGGLNNTNNSVYTLSRIYASAFTHFACF